jgi:hypothetical protein
MQTWQRVFGDRRELFRLDPRHAVARWHDKTGRGCERFLELVELHYPPAKTLEERNFNCRTTS